MKNPISKCQVVSSKKPSLDCVWRTAYLAAVAEISETLRPAVLASTGKGIPRTRLTAGLKHAEEVFKSHQPPIAGKAVDLGCDPSDGKWIALCLKHSLISPNVDTLRDAKVLAESAHHESGWCEGEREV
jgi:hypothetical protein